LTYESDSFDIITGEAALHHIIKYQDSLENLYRVLKPGGKAFFFEAFAFNPLINLLRNIKIRFKKYKGEHFLGSADIHYMESVFDSVIISDKSVLYTFSRFFKKPCSFNRKFSIIVKQLDNFVLPRFPCLNRYYSLAYLEMMKKE
jgi:ubiquinone/menaquinone biosynthesis C-methylase UbiE